MFIISKKFCSSKDIFTNYRNLSPISISIKSYFYPNFKFKNEKDANVHQKKEITSNAANIAILFQFNLFGV